MSSINVQFLGLPSEIIEFAEECAKLNKLNPVVVQLFPVFKAILVEDFELMNSISKLTRIDQIHLFQTEPDISTNEYMEFLHNNPDKLVFSMGKLTNDQLTESALSGITDNPDLLKIWKRIATKLRAMTLTGAWVVNPNNESKSFYKNIRYTNAAKKVFDEGLTISPGVGWNYYLLKSEEE